MRIAVVGGGLAGFSVAIMLLKHGFPNVVVFERDESLSYRRQGYGLTLLQGVAALKRLGVFETIKHNDTPSRSHYVFDSRGKIIGFFGTVFWEVLPMQVKEVNPASQQGGGANEGERVRK